MNKDTKKKNSEIDKESVKKLSDEDLDKVAGGLNTPCPPGCDVIPNLCVCPDDSDDDSSGGC